MDDLAAMDSPIHSLHPAAKLITTIAYILVTVSFGKYDLSGLLVMVLYPLFMFSLSGIRIRTCFYKLRVVLPLVCAVGLFNPIFDRAPMLYVGKLAVSGGVISMITLMLKGVFCLQASFLLASPTYIDALCAALRAGRLAGAVLDVFREEPLPADSPLRAAPNLWLLPHASAFSPDYVDLYFEELAPFLASL